MHQIICPNCKISRPADPHPQVQPVSCCHCKASIINLGALPLPVPNRAAISVQQPVAKVWEKNIRALCPLCGFALIDVNAGCPRCSCDLQRCAAIDFDAYRAHLAPEQISVCLRHARAGLNQSETLYILDRLTKSEMVELAETGVVQAPLARLPFKLKELVVESGSGHPGSGHPDINRDSENITGTTTHFLSKCYGFSALIFLIFGVISAALVWIFSWTGIAFILGLSLFWFVVFESPLTKYSFNPKKVVLQPEDEPRLFEMLGTLSKKASIRVTRVVLTPGYDLSCNPSTIWPWKNTYELSLGLPLLRHQTPERIGRLIAFSLGDQRASRVLNLHYHVLPFSLAGIVASFFVFTRIPLLSGATRVLWRNLTKNRRLLFEEKGSLGDLWTARQIGSQELVESLEEKGRGAESYQRYIREVFEEQWTSTSRPPLVDGFLAYLQFLKEKEIETPENKTGHAKIAKRRIDKILALEAQSDTSFFRAYSSAFSLDWVLWEDRLVRAGQISGYPDHVKCLPWDQNVEVNAADECLVLLEFAVLKPFAQIPLAGIPRRIQEWCEEHGANNRPREIWLQHIINCCSKMVGLAAVEKGAILTQRPGEKMKISKDGRDIYPEKLLRQCLNEETGKVLWETSLGEFCDLNLSYDDIRFKDSRKTPSESCALGQSAIPLSAALAARSPVARILLFSTIWALVLTLVPFVLEPSIRGLIRVMVPLLPVLVFGTLLFRRTCAGKSFVRIHNGELQFESKRGTKAYRLSELEYTLCRFYPSRFMDENFFGAHFTCSFGWTQKVFAFHFRIGSQEHVRYLHFAQVLRAAAVENRLKKLESGQSWRLGRLEMTSNTLRLREQVLAFDEISAITQDVNHLYIYQAGKTEPFCRLSTLGPDAKILPSLIESVVHQTLSENPPNPVYFQVPYFEGWLSRLAWLLAICLVPALLLLWITLPMNWGYYLVIGGVSALFIAMLVRASGCFLRIQKKSFTIRSFFSTKTYYLEDLDEFKLRSLKQNLGTRYRLFLRFFDGSTLRIRHSFYGNAGFLKFWLGQLEALASVGFQAHFEEPTTFQWRLGLRIKAESVEDRGKGVVIPLRELVVDDQGEVVILRSRVELGKQIEVPKSTYMFEKGLALLRERIIAEQGETRG